MKRGLFVISILVALIFLMACSPKEKIPAPIVEQPQVNEEPSPTETTEKPSVEIEEPEAIEEIPSEATVKITSSGFEPKTLTVKEGTTVTFVNEDSNKHWPASAMHPTHNVYPESGGCIGSKFDACKGLEQGESFSFTFNEKGSWNYHDHLRSSTWGTIIVE